MLAICTVAYGFVGCHFIEYNFAVYKPGKRHYRHTKIRAKGYS